MHSHFSVSSTPVHRAVIEIQALGKRANCQVAVSVHAATDTASCPLEWQLYLPREWAEAPDRCRRVGVPDGTGHQEKWRLALGLLDTLADWRLKAPVVVADAGYGVSTPSGSPSRNGVWTMCWR